jgi:replicative DNA helicase
MGKEQLATRLIAMESLVDSQKIRIGDLNDDELTKVVEAGTVIGNAPLVIDDTPSISVPELASKCRKIKQEQGLDLVIIDYLQLMTSGRRAESRQQEVAEISRSLKGLAKELDVPVIALSQLSRAVEARDDRKPRMSDLRESGSIEQDADVVMFIYRDEYYNPETTTKPGTAEIIIGKQRSGATGSVDLLWLGHYTKFANKERARARIVEPD